MPLSPSPAVRVLSAAGPVAEPPRASSLAAGTRGKCRDRSPPAGAPGRRAAPASSRSRTGPLRPPRPVESRPVSSAQFNGSRRPDRGTARPPLLATIRAVTPSPTSSDFDVVVLGGGPGGERAAIQAAKAHKRVALVERAAVVGGARVNWGTIPSKTLRESALFFLGMTRHRLHGFQTEVTDDVTVADFMYRERLVVQRELDMINASLGRYRIEVFRGHGRFLDPKTVAVEGKDGRRKGTLKGDVFVIATGSSPDRPADVPFDAESVFDSNTILKLPRMPKTMTVLGAGVIGIEYASIFAALGVYVTLVDTRDRLLPYLDREIVSILERELGELHVEILHDDRYVRVEPVPGASHRVTIETRQGRRITTHVLLYCVGR
ncbi:FAD-dependent oxidoreductase, partial [bacterium]|nr:FAD-dependent oxidoreductase [bacterium]